MPLWTSGPSQVSSRRSLLEMAWWYRASWKADDGGKFNQLEVVMMWQNGSQRIQGSLNLFRVPQGGWM